MASPVDFRLKSNQSKVWFIAGKKLLLKFEGAGIIRKESTTVANTWEN
jgi:hypothetical protein